MGSPAGTAVAMVGSGNSSVVPCLSPVASLIRARALKAVAASNMSAESATVAIEWSPANHTTSAQNTLERARRTLLSVENYWDSSIRADLDSTSEEEQEDVARGDSAARGSARRGRAATAGSVRAPLLAGRLSAERVPPSSAAMERWKSTTLVSNEFDTLRGMRAPSTFSHIDDSTDSNQSMSEDEVAELALAFAPDEAQR